MVSQRFIQINYFIILVVEKSAQLRSDALEHIIYLVFTQSSLINSLLKIWIKQDYTNIPIKLGIYAKVLSQQPNRRSLQDF